MRELPIYLFTGFLESGKTKFIQETLEDEGFNDGDSILVVVLEEGIEEYDESRFPKKSNVHIEIFDDPEDVTPQKLLDLQKRYDVDRVMIETNGMMLFNDLYEKLPDTWVVYQEMMFVDSTTFINYNTNMRALVVDKLQGAELVIFNRYDDSIDKMTLHKIVRGVNRRSIIAYEKTDGSVERDEIEDPLPYDIEAPVVEIQDEDYAIFFRDLSEETTKYSGKTVKYKGQVAFARNQPKGTFYFGRRVMTCCVEDIQYMPIMGRWKNASNLRDKQWLTVTGKIELEYNQKTGQKIPTLKVTQLVPAEVPNQEVATFY
jgi:G3E family GTPase